MAFTGSTVNLLFNFHFPLLGTVRPIEIGLNNNWIQLKIFSWHFSKGKRKVKISFQYPRNLKIKMCANVELFQVCNDIKKLKTQGKGLHTLVVFRLTYIFLFIAVRWNLIHFHFNRISNSFILFYRILHFLHKTKRNRLEAQLMPPPPPPTSTLLYSFYKRREFVLYHAVTVMFFFQI